MEIFIVWLVLAIAIAFWADSRGRSSMLFLFLSLVLSPLLAGIILLLSADLQKEKARRDEETREHERHMEELRALTASTRSESTPSLSLADELQKLSDLKGKGVLTEEEFQQQKDRLLSQGN